MTTMVEDTRVITGGVDTHADLHVAAALDSVGGLLGVQEFPADRVECSRDMHVGVRVHTAGDDARVFYHGGHSRPFHG